MAIPAADVKFLRTIHAGMNHQSLTSYIPGKRRCAQAMVLRFPGEDGNKVAKCFSRATDMSITPTGVIDRLQQHMDLEASSSISLFYIQRTDADSHRHYAGQVGFPGGFRDLVDDEDDLAAVKREAYEDVGFPLGRSSDFVLLGKIPDYKMKNIAQSTEEGVVLTRYVFLHIGEMNPTVKFRPYAIDGCQWCKIADLAKQKVEWNKALHPAHIFISWNEVQRRHFVKDFFPNCKIQFPSIAMSEGWQCWGVALNATNHLLQYEDFSRRNIISTGTKVSNLQQRLLRRRRLDFPYFRVSNYVVQYLLVGPYHGYLMLCEEGEDNGLIFDWGIALNTALVVGTILYWVAKFVIVLASLFAFIFQVLIKEKLEKKWQNGLFRLASKQGGNVESFDIQDSSLKMTSQGNQAAAGKGELENTMPYTKDWTREVYTMSGPMFLDELAPGNDPKYSRGKRGPSVALGSGEAIVGGGAKGCSQSLMTEQEISRLRRASGMPVGSLKNGALNYDVPNMEESKHSRTSFEQRMDIRGYEAEGSTFASLEEVAEMGTEEAIALAGSETENSDGIAGVNTSLWT